MRISKSTLFIFDEPADTCLKAETKIFLLIKAAI
jgi:hypothetical protein